MVRSGGASAAEAKKLQQSRWQPQEPGVVCLPAVVSASTSLNMSANLLAEKFEYKNSLFLDSFTYIPWLQFIRLPRLTFSPLCIVSCQTEAFWDLSHVRKKIPIMRVVSEVNNRWGCGHLTCCDITECHKAWGGHRDTAKTMTLVTHTNTANTEGAVTSLPTHLLKSDQQNSGRQFTEKKTT